jgi:hypothetical protein
MSDESAKTVDPSPRPFNWGTPEKITVFFCVNLLAFYVPAVVCVRDLPTESPALTYLISPVLFAGFVMGSTSEVVGWFLLAVLILLLFVAAAVLHNSWKAWVAIPTIVFAYSLLQAMAAVGLIIGLNGVAHS